MSSPYDRLPEDCFLCGHICWPNTDVLWFEKDHPLLRLDPAPAHRLCLLAKSAVRVAAAYHRWIADRSNIARAGLGAVGRA